MLNEHRATDIKRMLKAFFERVEHQFAGDICVRCAAWKAAVLWQPAGHCKVDCTAASGCSAAQSTATGKKSQDGGSVRISHTAAVRGAIVLLQLSVTSCSPVDVHFTTGTFLLFLLKVNFFNL